MIPLITLAKVWDCLWGPRSCAAGLPHKQSQLSQHPQLISFNVQRFLLFIHNFSFDTITPEFHRGIPAQLPSLHTAVNYDPFTPTT